MINFFWLFFAHAIGEFQTDFVSSQKHKYPMVLAWHCIWWTGCIVWITSEKIGLSFPLWKIIFLSSGHAICDFISAGKFRDKGVSFNVVNTLDQLWHLIQLLIVYLL